MAQAGVTHMLATVNPEVEERFFRCGYEPLGPVLDHADKGVAEAVLKGILRLRQLIGFFLRIFGSFSSKSGCLSAGQDGGSGD